MSRQWDILSMNYYVPSVGQNYIFYILRTIWRALWITLGAWKSSEEDSRNVGGDLSTSNTEAT